MNIETILISLLITLSVLGLLYLGLWVVVRSFNKKFEDLENVQGEQDDDNQGTSA